MTVTYYLGSVLDTSILTTASDISIASGATAVGQDSPLGTLSGYGELCPHSAPGTWPAAVSESAVLPSGKGNIYPITLAGQTILAGNWTPTLKLTLTGISATAITADVILRVWLYNNVSHTYTKYGVITLTAQSIPTTGTTFTLPATALTNIAGGAGDYLYLDCLANVTSNSNGAGVGAKIRVNFSVSASTGNASGQVVAPNTVSARVIPMSAALKGTSTRTVPATASVAMVRRVPTTAAVSGAPHRLVPCSASVCTAPLALPYVQPIADTNFITASGRNLMYKGNPIRLYGATIYLSTQGGAAQWQTTDLSATLNSLFTAAWQNGLSMIRITDFWDGAHITALDNVQLWRNIDYCVTLAQRMNMFVMMDISAYKNVLIAQGKDYTQASNWFDFLTFVGLHYKGTATAICWYNLLGEPSLPTDQASVDALANFYGTLTSTIYAADGGTHLIEAGGLTHMNSVVAGISYPTWWYPIYTLPHNDICAYKTYSVNDLAYMSTIQTQMAGINKPLSNNEFGAQQEQGDTSFPAFTNTISAPITIGATVTSLPLATPIAQSVIAGTIISVSGTENFVVSATTSSGSSLPVTSATAAVGHIVGDSVTALGFADVGHSLADTADNFYKAVLGTATTIKKWNSGPRTVVNTTVPGGDQIGTTSYVAWNLGYQISPTGYDVSVTQQPGAWLILRNKAMSDGYRIQIFSALFPLAKRRAGFFPSTKRRQS